MYTTRNRLSSFVRYSGTGYGFPSSVSLNCNMEVPNFLEGVYSWRTGPNNVSDPSGNPPIKQRNQDGWGLIAPSKTGSFDSKLADRKRYLEDFSRMAVTAETDAGTPSTNRISTTDTGHPFGSLKILRSPYRAHIDYLHPTNGRYVGDAWSSVATSSIPNSTPYTYGFPVNTASPLVVSASNRQGTANRYFAATAPDRAGASIGVTLIELIRGDIPTLLKNFQEMMAYYKTFRNYVGSETLNIMFGWTPLIQEWANVIKVGMALERVVYYESFRRKRNWDGPSFNRETTRTRSINSIGTPYGNASAPKQGAVTTSTGFGKTYATQEFEMAVEDYHLTSKYTGLAKAGRRAESFSDQAMDVAKRMGVVDDPRLIWDLTPYSWLVDWFTTMGASISNAQVYAPFSGKYTSDYAYMTTKHTYLVEGTLLRATTGPDSYFRDFSVTSGKSSLNSVSLWRARATPFGFGTQLGSLSASQFAILVALGFAKTR